MLEHVDSAVIMLGCRQDMEIEIDRFEVARAQIAEVGCSCVLVSWFDVLEHCLLEHCLLEHCLLEHCFRLSASQLSDMTARCHPQNVGSLKLGRCCMNM